MGSTYFKEDQNSLDFNTFVLTKRMLSCLHHDGVWRCIEMLTKSHKFPITWRKCWVFLHVIHVAICVQWVLELVSETLSVALHEWALDLNVYFKNLSFCIVGISIMMQYYCLQTTFYVPMTCIIFENTIHRFKNNVLK